MRVKVHFRDGFTGGVLTNEQPHSADGSAVLVTNEYTRAVCPGSVLWGPGDADGGVLVLEEPASQGEIDCLRAAGWKVEDYR